jgi:hypothetical protein
MQLRVVYYVDGFPAEFPESYPYLRRYHSKLRSRNRRKLFPISVKININSELTAAAMSSMALPAINASS